MKRIGKDTDLERIRAPMAIVTLFSLGISNKPAE